MPFARSYLNCVSSRLYAFQLERMKTEFEAALIRHLKRGERISLFTTMSIGIIVTNVSHSLHMRSVWFLFPQGSVVTAAYTSV